MQIQNVNKLTTPILRFEGFEMPWEQTCLGDISESPMYGMNAPATNYDGKNIYLRITDINDSNGRLKKSDLTSPGAELNDVYLLKTGDLLFTRTGASTGKAYLYQESDGKIYYAGFLIKFSITKADPKFVYFSTLTSQYWKWVKTVSMRSGQPGINAQEYSKYMFFIPKLSEQKKISLFLSSIDEWVENLRIQKESLEEYKKGMMQKLFSQEIRFKNDNGQDFPAWEMKKAGEIFENYSNKSHNGDLPLLAVTQENGVIFRDSLNLKINSSEAGIKNYKIIEPGNFVISLRSFQGGIEYSTIKGISSPAYTVLKSKIPINDMFFKILFKKDSFITKLNSLIYGIRDGKQISYSEFKGMVLPFPTLLEQNKIVNFLITIDKLIELKISQIDVAEKWKKGLMQKMFI